MASKYERITDLYLQTAGEVATPEVWPRFLTTACYNFRLSFDKQVLLYAQCPDATGSPAYRRAAGLEPAVWAVGQSWLQGHCHSGQRQQWSSENQILL